MELEVFFFFNEQFIIEYKVVGKIIELDFCVVVFCIYIVKDQCCFCGVGVIVEDILMIQVLIDDRKLEW